MKTIDLRLAAIICTLFSAVIFLGSSNGPAANGNFFTGAPSAGGGTEGTCNTCHSSGAGTYGEPVVNVSFATDGEVQDLTAYVPGQTYQVTVAIGDGSINAPEAYGFSSQFLNLANSPATPAGTLGNPGAGVRISDGSGERKYAEQSVANTDSTFTFEWTAPEAGMGEIRYYVAGNLVNLAAGTSGDSGSTMPTIVTLAEGNPSSTRNLSGIEHALFPNPASDEATLRVSPERAGDYQLSLLGIDGRMQYSKKYNLGAGTTNINVPINDLRPGIYLVRLTGADSRLVSRLIVR